MHRGNVRLDKVDATEVDRRRKVVSVHDHVDERVEHRRVPGLSGRGEEGDEPPDEENRRVVVDVKEGDLVVVALNEHNEGVDEFRDLAEVEAEKVMASS